jgi:hypothetical protein
VLVSALASKWSCGSARNWPTVLANCSPDAVQPKSRLSKRRCFTTKLSANPILKCAMLANYIDGVLAFPRIPAQALVNAASVEPDPKQARGSGNSHRQRAHPLERGHNATVAFVHRPESAGQEEIRQARSTILVESPCFDAARHSQAQGIPQAQRGPGTRVRVRLEFLQTTHRSPY